MRMTKKMTEVSTYKLMVSNEERRTIMDALAMAIDSDECTVNKDLCSKLFHGMKASNASQE